MGMPAGVLTTGFRGLTPLIMVYSLDFGRTAATAAAN